MADLPELITREQIYQALFALLTPLLAPGAADGSPDGEHGQQLLDGDGNPLGGAAIDRRAPRARERRHRQGSIAHSGEELMDYLALLQTILAALSQAPEAIQIAEDAYNGVRASFGAEDQA